MKKRIKPKYTKWDSYEIMRSQPDYCGTILAVNLEQAMEKYAKVFAASPLYFLIGKTTNTLSYEVFVNKNKDPFLRTFVIQPSTPRKPGEEEYIVKTNDSSVGYTSLF